MPRIVYNNSDISPAIGQSVMIAGTPYAGTLLELPTYPDELAFVECRGPASFTLRYITLAGIYAKWVDCDDNAPPDTLRDKKPLDLPLTWQMRETQAQISGARALPGFLDVPYMLLKAIDPLYGPPYFLHVSAEEPHQWAYTPSADYGERGRQVRLSPGKFLTKMVMAGAVTLTADEVRTLTNGFAACLAFNAASDATAKLELKFATTIEEIEKVYTTGEENPVCAVGSGTPSCMSRARENYGTALHPSALYAASGGVLAVAHLSDGIGTRARAVVNTRDLRYVRVYERRGSKAGTKLQEALHAAGYARRGSLSGQGDIFLNVEMIRNGNKHEIVAPYLDGEDRLACDDDTGSGLRMTADDGVACDTQNGNVSLSYVCAGGNEYECAHCGGTFRDDESLRGVAGGDQVCDSCIDEHFVYVENADNYYPLEACVEVYSASGDWRGTRWFTERYASHNFYRWSSGDWFDTEETEECDSCGDEVASGDLHEVRQGHAWHRVCEACRDEKYIEVTRGRGTGDFVLLDDAATIHETGEVVLRSDVDGVVLHFWESDDDESIAHAWPEVQDEDEDAGDCVAHLVAYTAHQTPTTATTGATQQ
jgi:hypothetical protein